MKVGVLALQGDVAEHRAVLKALGADVTPVRGPSDLGGLDALVLPGGESTTIGLLLESADLFEPLSRELAGGMPVLGTCAGMILLATEVIDGRPDQRTFGMLDIAVRRNGFGRQVASFEADVAVDGAGEDPVHAVFIRAPRVESAGPAVQVLARTADGVPVVCRQGSAVACSFHPELTGDGRLHEMVLSRVR